MRSGRETDPEARKHLHNVIARKAQETAGQPGPQTLLTSVSTTKFRPKRKRSKQSYRGANQQQMPKRQSRGLRLTDHRLPKVGTIISKTYKGQKINVRVPSNGFEDSGKPLPVEC